MFPKLDEMQAFGKANMDATTASLGAFSKGFQAIATELADYSKKIFEEGATATENLLKAKTPEKAFEVHGAYIKSTYDAFVVQSTKIGDLYAGIARDVFKPYESRPAKASASK